MPKVRVAIVGGGAAGMSAAFALSLVPDHYEVQLYERSSQCGGMATSTSIDAQKYGADYINDGVQGGSPVFKNTFAMMEKLGFRSTKVGFQISFGREPGIDFWSNVFPSDLIDKHVPSIRRFQTLLTTSKTLEPIFALMPIHTTLSLFRFPRDFSESIVFPLVALFMGTGNQTPFVSTAIVERLFLDPSMRLFDYSRDTFLDSIPDMRAFPKLGEVYSRWKEEVECRGNVKVCTNTEVLSVLRSHKYVDPYTRKRQEGVKVVIRPTTGVGNDQEVSGYAGKEEELRFDELIMACDADAALKVLGKDASWLEKKVLGNVKYLWDITVTHSDLQYMDKYYRLHYSDDLASKKRLNDKSDKKAQDAFQFAREQFTPLYYIRSYPEDKKKLEMSFDLTNYQPQFLGVGPRGPDNENREISGSDSRDQWKENELPQNGKPVNPSMHEEQDASKVKEYKGADQPTETTKKETIKTSMPHREDAYSEDMSLEEEEEYGSPIGDHHDIGPDMEIHSDTQFLATEDTSDQSVYPARHLPFGERPRLEDHVFQSIFLDRDGSEKLWSRSEINKDKVILEKWWKQQSHRWQHYAGTVPYMMFLNGKRHTHYAGAWTVLNMHEIAVVSGFAAAYRLGAPFPFKEKEGCGRLFKLYLAASHGVRVRKEDRESVFV